MALIWKQVWELNPGDRMWVDYDREGAIVDHLELVSPTAPGVRIVWASEYDQKSVKAEWDRHEIVAIYPPEPVKLAKYLAVGDRVVFGKKIKTVGAVYVHPPNGNIVVQYAGFWESFKDPHVYEPNQEIDVEA